MEDRASLWMGQPFMGLIHQSFEDPLLDLSSSKDPPLNLMLRLMTSYDRHEEGPTMGWTTGEELLKIQA